MQDQSIPVIDEFLKQWKKKALEYYNNVIDGYMAIEKEINNTIEKYNRRFSLSEEERKQVIKDHNEKWEKVKRYRENNKTALSIISGYHPKEREERLNKALDKEVERKKKTLIARIEKKAGNILDANGLCIASNGEINGTITGSIKTVCVNTIYAGGYNIQCLHYRVLVK
jgi:flagellar motor component MotA